MSTSVFPGGVDNDTNLIRVLSTDTVIPAQHNNLNDAIQAVEGYLFDGVAAAKGAIAVGSAAEALGSLAVGADGDVLTADSTQALGVKWAPGGGGGSPIVVDLGADVTLTPVDTWKDLVTDTPAAGDYLIFASALSQTTTGDYVGFRIFDGTSALRSGESTGSAANLPQQCSLAPVKVTSDGTKTYHFQAASHLSAGSFVRAELYVNSQGDNATSMTLLPV